MKRLTCPQMGSGGWQAERFTLSLIHECVCEVAGRGQRDWDRRGVSLSGCLIWNCATRPAVSDSAIWPTPQPTQIANLTCAPI